MYFECHITLNTPLMPEYVYDMKVDIETAGWKFSSIAGDPTLGNKQFCYATKHYAPKTSRSWILAEMNDLAILLHSKGYDPIRQKVEVVVYDSTGHQHTN